MNLFMSIFLLLVVVAVIAIVAFIIILITRSGQKSRQEYAQYQQANGNGNGMPNNTPPFAQDAPSLGYAVLGFFIPLVGLILFLTWQSSFPFRARSAGKGALASVICGVVISVLITVLGVLGMLYM